MELSSKNSIKRGEDGKRPNVQVKANVVALVDRSGSMQSCGDGPSQGLRVFLKEQKKMADQGSQVMVKVVTFDNVKEIPFHGDASTITDQVIDQCIESIFPRNTTRFYDTLAETIQEQEKEIKDMMDNLPSIQKKLGVKISGTCAIITDGQDNASLKYNRKDIKKLVEKHRKNGILCQFIAANMNALETGKSYGFAEENSLQMGANAINAEAAMLAITSSQSRQHSGMGIPAFTPLERQTSSDIHYNHNLYQSNNPLFDNATQDYDDYDLAPLPNRKITRY